MATISLLGTVLLVNCSTPQSPLTSSAGNKPTDRPISGASKEERRLISKLAISGDADAAFWMYRYSQHAEKNQLASTQWLARAVVNGSGVGQTSFANKLYTLSREEAWDFAQAFLEIAAKNGYARAEDSLRIHDEKVRMYKNARKPKA